MCKSQSGCDQIPAGGIEKPFGFSHCRRRNAKTEGKMSAPIRGIASLALVLGVAASSSQAQPAGRGPAEYWWVNKTEGGVYKAPNRPLWRVGGLEKEAARPKKQAPQNVFHSPPETPYKTAA